MARIQGKDIYLRVDDQIYFGETPDAALWYDGDELRIDHTVSGVDAIEQYHLVTLRQVPDEFVDLDDTPGSYVGSGEYIVRVKSDETGLDFVPSASGVDLSFLDLNDTPTTYSGSEHKYARVTEDGTSLYFEDAIVGVTSTGTVPPENSNLWFNANENEFYYYDSSREEWLSMTVHNYLYTRQGLTNALYMSVGDLRYDGAHYLMPKPAIITGITSSAEEVFEPAKGFEIQDGVGNVLFSFNHVDWKYINYDADIDLDSGTELRTYCVSTGQSVKNPAITLEVRWRYVY